jgi:hypothetical protein
MAARSSEERKPDNARDTYLYFRIGMIGVAVLLVVAIGIERSKVDCFQRSISAYYYTPVRAIFVGFLIAVGFTLIVYKGRTYWEDLWLNLSGMLAPLVAVAPTTDFGACWSIEPSPLPKIGGILQDWVVRNIENNFQALVWAGIAGLFTGIVLAVVTDRKRLTDWKTDEERRREALGRWIPMIGVLVALTVALWASEYWDPFNERAHGFAAVGMIVFLGFAIIAHGRDHRKEADKLAKAAAAELAEAGNRAEDRNLTDGPAEAAINRKRHMWYRHVYYATAGAMAIGGLLIAVMPIFGDHTTLWLEGYEIALFAFYWIVQTIENAKEANEEVVPTPESEGALT